MFHYATKADLKNATGLDAPSLDQKTDLANLKSDEDTKIKNIADKIPDITNLATNTTLNAKINKVKNEIPSITNLTTTDFNAEINEVKSKIPNISNLATNTDIKYLMLVI